MSFVTKVADLFLERCRNVTIISPSDFVLIAEWEKQEIPLDIILKSINELCDEAAVVTSFDEFQRLVQQNFIEWLQVTER